jgi:8-oxo-dGTP pyrophosphatase MutT (NUDIX family)
MPKPWTVLSSKFVIDTPWLRLRRDEVALPNGTHLAEYFVRESRGFTIVVALTPERDVVLVRQYKHGAGEELLELPAGSIDPGETPEACAVRELAEETGYASPTPLERIGTYVTDSTNSDSRWHLYLARDVVVVGAQDLDVTEEIDVETVSLAELRAMLRDGRFSVSPHVAAAYAAMDYLRLLG